MQGQHTKRFPVLPSRQALKTGVGFVLIAFSVLAAGPCQLWKAENRAKLGALLGFTGPAPIVSPPPLLRSLLLHMSHRHLSHQRLLRQHPPGLLRIMRRTSRQHLGLPGGSPSSPRPNPRASFWTMLSKTRPLPWCRSCDSRGMRTWTDPHKVHVYRVAEPADNHTSAGGPRAGLKRMGSMRRSAFPILGYWGSQKRPQGCIGFRLF